MKDFSAFLKKKDIEFSVKRYALDALSLMTIGLFSSLIIGLILKEVGTRLNIDVFFEAGVRAMAVSGAAIGAAAAYALKAPPLVLFASIATGFVGNELGGPAGAFISTIIGTEFGKLVSKETKVDIIVTPTVSILCGYIAAVFIGPVINMVMLSFGNFIMWTTELMPFFMGIIISVVMGMVLTLPISSVALSIMIELSGIAAGAATAGCSAQMIGFAVASYRENKVSGLISQGIGTSMTQMPNIIKNPRIWVPVILTSAITGGLSTTVFKMENIPTGAGMGTSGLVGQFGTLSAMGYSADVIIKIIVLHFLLPAVLSFMFSEIMRKKGLIKFGDMKLQA